MAPQATTPRTNEKQDDNSIEVTQDITRGWHAGVFLNELFFNKLPVKTAEQRSGLLSVIDYSLTSSADMPIKSSRIQ